MGNGRSTRVLIDEKERTNAPMARRVERRTRRRTGVARGGALGCRPETPSCIGCRRRGDNVHSCGLPGNAQPILPKCHFRIGVPTTQSERRVAASSAQWSTSTSCGLRKVVCD